MPLAWNDDASWILSTEQPLFACAPPYVGNGRLGLRLGALILGTDPDAPALSGAGPERCFMGTPRFDHTWPLQAFAAHGSDGFQYCLPSWAQLRLRIGNDEFRPLRAITGSRKPLTTWLDLRTGEAGLDGTCMAGGSAVRMRIRLLVPRSCPHGAFWELELDNLSAGAEVEFGFDGDHLVADLEQSYRLQGQDIIGTARTRGRGRTMHLGLRWSAQGAAEIGTDVTGADGVSGAAGAHARVRLRSSGKTMRLVVLHACHGGSESGGPAEVRADLDALATGVADGSTRRDNATMWRALWSRGLDVTALPLDADARRFLLAQQFYLLASYDESSHPVAPIGLSGNQWAGQMWDADLWHGRALAILWPELARRLVRARLAMLPVARERARAAGLRGAWLAWMSDDEGREMSPPGPYRQELHVNAWAMLLPYELWLATRDRAVLEEAWPLLSEVADFWCSRCTLGADGAWHLLRALGPDESVHENPSHPQLCDDHLTTSLALRAALRAAIAAAGELGREAPPEWRVVADGVRILEPGADGVIPEYAGYNGHPIKQADVILAFYPLGHRMPADAIAANLAYYHARMECGPLMSEQIEAAVRFQLGREPREAVLADLLREYRRCVRGPFHVPYEVSCNSNSLMLTACGGLVQALACGWWDYRRPGDDAALIPRLGCADAAPGVSASTRAAGAART